MKNWIINKWDWWVYWKAMRSLKRMSKYDIAFTYLMELHLRDYNQRVHSLPALKSATEYFYNSLPENNEN